MKTKLFLITLCFCHFTARAQLSSLGKNYNTDSLLTLLKTDREDTDKVFHLYSIAREISNRNSDTAILLCNQALQLAEKLNWEKGEAYSNIIAGWCKNVQGDYPKSLAYSFKGLSIGEKTGNKKIISVALTSIGSVYQNESDYQQALNYFFKALKLDEELGNKWGIARNLGMIGTAYYKLKNYPDALDYYLKALNMTEEIGNKNGTAVWLGNIGNIYQDQQDYPKALDYFFKSLKILDELANKWVFAENLRDIGLVYISTQKYSESFEYLYRALALSDSVGAMDNVKSCYEALSTLYEKSTIPLQDSTGGKFLNNEQMRLRALYYHKRYISVNDTLFSRQRQKQILNFEFEIKDAAAKARTDAELKKQKLLRNGFVGGFAVVLLFAGVFFRQRNKIKKEKLRAETALDELKRAQQKLVEKEKLAAIGIVAKRMAHEIQNPLNFVNNFSELSEELTADLANAKTEEERQEIISAMKENMSKINHHGKHAEGIIKKLQQHLNEGKGLDLFEK